MSAPASLMQPRASNESARAAEPARAAPGPVTIVAHDIGSVGGMERQLAELITGLRRRGHEVVVIARTCELPEDPGVAFHRVPGPRRPFLLFYAWFALAGSLAVRRWRRGVVQATGAVVLNHVDAVEIHFCHQAYQRETPGRRSWPARLNVALGGFVKRAAERLCVRANPSAAYVCVSEGLAEEMRAHYPQIAQRVLTIHNGVDTRSFAPASDGERQHAKRARLGLAPGRLVAVFVGGEWARKGLAAAIEAIALAPAWDLVVAGTGDRRFYQELADTLGVGDAVHWLGVVSDIQAIYKLADAFVLPSSYETFSLVTFEAAASGLPILAAPVNGVRELIRDGENGFLIGTEPQGIAERLSELAADPGLRARLGGAARESALQFTWERSVAEHEQLYARLARGL
jgi:UDP-glucose:(heptosyl)LPS alpha-1,3-glucosyltransferase